MKLFMVLLGCRPAGRNTEQHDIFFGLANNLKGLLPQMKKFWPGVNLHIDAYREITQVNGFAVSVVKRNRSAVGVRNQLFFINLGGYRDGEFEEYHYKVLTVAANVSEAIKHSKQTAFFKHYGIQSPGGVAHVDDKFGIDVDDIIKIEEVLDPLLLEKYTVKLIPALNAPADKIYIGYLPFSKLK